MSLTTNNTNLQTILDTVNALPDAGSGSSTPETCTVTISKPKGNTSCLYVERCSRLVDGKEQVFEPGSRGLRLFGYNESGTKTITNVIVGSIVRINHDLMDIAYWSLDANVEFQVSSDTSYEQGNGTLDSYEPMWTNGSTIGENAAMRYVSEIVWGIPFKILGDTTISIWDED